MAVAGDAVDGHHHLWNPSDPGQGSPDEADAVLRSTATATYRLCGSVDADLDHQHHEEDRA